MRYFDPGRIQNLSEAKYMTGRTVLHATCHTRAGAASGMLRVASGEKTLGQNNLQDDTIQSRRVAPMFSSLCFSARTIRFGR